MEVGEVGPLGAGIFLHHQLHPLFIEVAAHVGIALTGGGAVHNVGAVHLPANVGSAVEAFGGHWRGGEKIIDAVVEAHGVERGVAASVAAAGLILGVGGFAEDHLVAVGSGQADQ